MSLTPVNPAELLPVPTSIYQALAEFNHAFEKLIRDLDTLKNCGLFDSEALAAKRDLLCRIHAETNYDLTETLRARELSNSSYYDRLCMNWEELTKDPGDVLLEAEEIKRRMKEEQRQQSTLERSKQRKKAR
ncbi:MAG: hypothetical protein DMG65_12625 [Candidatus Angelobacter sp. Gp1-AA117]|nr:MAG: hypothetical protein DMG65_12625 [Candidatus Angelobacter sp. Gp1-AA117]